MIRGASVSIQNSGVHRFVRPLRKLDAVKNCWRRRFDLFDPFSKPLVGIQMIERDAGLENFDQGETGVFDGVDYQ